MMAGRDCSGPAAFTPMPPQAEAPEETGRQAPQAIAAQPGIEREPSGEALPVTAGKRGNLLTRLPVQAAHLVKSQNLAKVIEKYAEQYGVDQDLVWAVIRQESGFNSHAVSPKGAMGLMQLMPGTAAGLGVTDAFDVEQNIAGGIKYLERCLSRFNQDVSLALAAYNAGPDNVVKYQGCPPFAETRHYVATVLAAYAGGTGAGRPATPRFKSGHGRRSPRPRATPGISLAGSSPPMENFGPAIQAELASLESGPAPILSSWSTNFLRTPKRPIIF